MAAGDLSPDQARFVDLVTSETGLNRTVVVAWVGTESGWGTNKAGHNYLNIGPGRTYPSTEQAAAAVAGLINNGNLYYAVKASIPAGPAAQIAAIGQSPWGTSAALLTKVYGGLAGAGAPVAATNVSFVGDAASAAAGALAAGPLAIAGALGIGPDAPALAPIAGALGSAASGAVGSAVSSALSGLGPILIEAGLTVIFTVAAFAFIAMGINRLTGGSVKEVFNTVSGAVGAGAGAAKLAAL